MATTTRSQLISLIAESLISTFLDMAEDAATDFIEEVTDDEGLIWNRLKIPMTPEIIQHERQALAVSIVRAVTHKLATGPVNEAEDWQQVRDAHPRQLMLL